MWPADGFLFAHFTWHLSGLSWASRHLSLQVLGTLSSHSVAWGSWGRAWGLEGTACCGPRAVGGHEKKGEEGAVAQGSRRSVGVGGSVLWTWGKWGPWEAAGGQQAVAPGSGGQWELWGAVGGSGGRWRASR